MKCETLSRKMFLLSASNRKLNDQTVPIIALPVLILNFDLPAGLNGTCNRSCPGCYFLQCCKVFKSLQAKVEKNYQESLMPGFGRLVIEDIRLAQQYHPKVVVRIHAGGDFYSSEYLNKWKSIASALPNVQFYAFSKRPEVDEGTRNGPSNLVIHWEQGINFGKGEAPKGYFKCPCNKSNGLTGICGRCQICFKQTKESPWFEQH